MIERQPHRKLVKHYHEPGDLHELTFSCYRRLPLLTNDAWREALSRSMDAACEAEHMKLVAFVYMPEHVHLLLCPLSKDPRIDIFLKRVKRPVSVTARDDLRQSSSRLLPRRTVQERPGKTVFRFWQEGPGDDRNLQTCEAVQASIDYIHTNPVKRKLCKIAATWRWSSARQYEFPGEPTDPALPRVTFLPADYWDALATRHKVELT